MAFDNTAAPANPFSGFSSDDQVSIHQQLTVLRQSGKLNPAQSAGVDRALGFLNPQPQKPVSPAAPAAQSGPVNPALQTGLNFVKGVTNGDASSSIFDDEHLGKAIGWLGEHVNPIVQAPVQMGEAGAKAGAAVAEMMGTTSDTPPAMRGVVRGVGSVVGSTVANPTNLPFLFTGGGAVRPVLQRAMATGFATQMGHGAVEQAGQLGAVMDNPDVSTEQKYEMGTGAVIGTGMAGFAGSGILHRDVPPTPERPLVETRPTPEAAPATTMPPPSPKVKNVRAVRPSPKPAEAADVAESTTPPETEPILSETQPTEAVAAPPPPSPKERSIAQATRPSPETLAALKDEQETRTLSNLAAYGETKAKLRDVQREIDGAEAATAGNFDRGARTPDELSTLKAQAESLKSTAITELKTHAAGLTDEEAQSLITSIEAPLYKLFGQATQLHRLVTDDPAAKQIRRVLVADVSRTGLPPDLEEIATKHLNEQIVGGRLTREVGGQRDRLFEQLGVYRDPSKQVIKIIKRMPTGEAGERIKARIEETHAKLSAMRDHSEPAMQRKIDHLLTQNVIMTDGRVRQKPTAVADQFTSVALSGKFHEISADNLKAVLGKKAVPDLVGRMSPEEIEIAKNLQGTEEGLKVRQEAARRNISELRDKAIARVSENMRLVKAIKEARRVPEGSLTPLETSVAALMDQVQRQKEGTKETQVAPPKPALAAAPAAVETAATAREAAANEKLPLVDKLQGVVDRLKRGDAVDYDKLKAIENAGIVKTLGRSNGQIADDLQLKVNRMRGRQKGAETLAAKRAAAGAEATEARVKTPQPTKPVSPEAQAADASMQALKAKTDAAALEKKLAAYDQISTMLKTAQHIPADILKRTRAKLSLPDDVGPGKLAASIDAYTREIRERQAPPAGLASEAAKTSSRAEAEKPSAPAPAASAALTPEETAVYQRAKSLEGDIQKVGTDHVEAIEKMRDAVKALGGTRLERYLSYERGLDAYNDAVQKQDPWAYRKALDAAKMKSQAGVLGDSPRINDSIEQQRDVAKFWSAATLGRYEKMSESQLARFKDRVFGPELEKMTTEAGDPGIQQRLAALRERAGVPEDPIESLRQVIGGHEFSAEDLTKGIIREHGGELARQKEQLFHELDSKPTRAESGMNPIEYGWEYLKSQVRLDSKLDSVIDRWDKASIHESVGFIDKIEKGDFEGIAEAKDRAIAQRLRQMLDTKRDAIADLGTGLFENYIENYWPHIWANVPRATSLFARILGSKRPLAGPEGFLKQRYYSLFAEGMAAGLEPVTYNPVKLALLRLHEMDRYLFAHKSLDAMKEAGTAKFFKFGDEKPNGWTTIDDRLFQPKHKNDEGALVANGSYFAPEPAARVINNYLSPGLREKFKVYDIVRNYSNLLNQSQLGLSAFHLGFTALDASISDAALGLEKAMRGDIKGAAKPMLRGLTLTAPFSNYVRGSKLLANYLDPSRFQEMSQIASAVEKAGGSAVLDPFYKNSALDKYWNAWKEMKEAPGMVKVPKAVKTSIRAAGAALELAAKPMMEHMVPRMKLGVFASMAEDLFHRYEGQNIPQEVIRQELQKIYDSVENRMGQLRYDNLFWNRSVKDIAMLGVRSLGWNIGTIREIGGGLKDTFVFGMDLGQKLKGAEKNPEFTRRMAYTIALPVVTATVGTALGFLYTGKVPQTMTDLWHIPTGRLDENGQPERVNIASYMRDVYAFSHHPLQTVVHKLHPTFAALAELYQNSDYYGNEIYDPNDSWTAEGKAVGEYLAKQFEPFSARNFQERKKAGASSLDAASSMIGITPSPKYIGRSDAENLAYDLARRAMPAGPRDPIMAARSQAIKSLTSRYLRGDITPDDVFKEVDAGKITPDDADKVLDAKTQTPIERYTSRLPAHQALKVWEKATHDERDRLMPEMLSKWDNLEGTYSGPQLDSLQKAYSTEVGNHR